MKRYLQKILTTIALIPVSLIYLHAQGYNVSGTVTDENGASLPGVNVLIEGSNNGTVTDIDGEYTIKVPSEESVLNFSYIGYNSESIGVDGRSVIDISLVPNITELTEVVVVGYGSMKKSDVTGAITSISKEDIADVKSSNAIESLQGKAAGVDLVRESGRAGAGYDVLVRGKRSLSASNEPLYIVDGVQYGTSNIDINPNDIESIEVLKDASSTAIYGSRGANGVVIITTKKGKKGEGKISFNTYAGVTMPNGEIPLADKEYYLQFMNDLNWMREWAFDPDALPTSNGYLNELRASEKIGLEQGVDYDWYDGLLRNGFQQNYNLSFSGATDAINYNTSVNYYSEKGLIEQDNFQRLSLRLNLDGDITDFLNMGTSSVVSYSKNKFRDNPLGDARKLSPLVDPYDSVGNIEPYPRFPDEVVNPFISADPEYHLRESRDINVFSTIYVNAQITDDIFYKTSFNMDFDIGREGIYNGVFPGINGTSSAQSTNKNGTDYTWQNIIGASKQLSDHKFELTLGNEIIYRRDEKYRSYGEDLSLPGSQWYALGSAGTNISIALESDDDDRPLEETKLVSFFGRLHYGFKDKYLFQFTSRYDGASQLAPGGKWEFFPSASFAWRAKEEPFLQNVEFLSNLKFRLGYGTSGSQAVPAYSFFGTVSRNPLYYEFGVAEQQYNGFRTATNENYDLTWEKTKAYNIGVDFGILNNRIQGSVELYRTETSDLLQDLTLSPHSGITSIVSNVGSTQNQGVEITLNTKNIDTKGFEWSSDITFYTNHEEITKLASGREQDLLNGWFVGQPVDVYYDLEKTGIWQEDERERAADYGLKPGDIKFNDVNGDTIYNDLDRVIIGDPRPDFTLGFNNRVSYKNFDLSFFVFTRWGQTIEDDVKTYFQVDGLGNTMKLDYWTPFNPTNDTPRPDPSRTRSGYQELAANAYTDGSFIKFRDITLGYTVPSDVAKTLNMSKLRIYVSAKNPIIISDFFSKGRWDPELRGDIDIPMPKMYSAGLNVSF